MPTYKTPYYWQPFFEVRDRLPRISRVFLITEFCRSFPTFQSQSGPRLNLLLPNDPLRSNLINTRYTLHYTTAKYFAVSVTEEVQWKEEIEFGKCYVFSNITDSDPTIQSSNQPTNQASSKQAKKTNQPNKWISINGCPCGIQGCHISYVPANQCGRIRNMDVHDSDCESVHSLADTRRSRGQIQRRSAEQAISNTESRTML